MKRRTLVLFVAVVTVAAAALLASTFVLVSGLTLHDQGAVRFGASLNATTVAQAQAVRVYVDDWNTLDFKNSLPLSNSQMAAGLSSGPCGGPYPGGIAVYKGEYDMSNVSSATPLPFYAPGTYFCTELSFANSFTFGPHQNVTAYFDLDGYYVTTNATAGAFSSYVLQPYAPGVYTVVAGDPLGHTRVMYFRVTGTTGTAVAQERSGPVSTFPATWLNPCDTSASGNVTTAVYLGLNGSSAFDHINLGQVYSQIVNSSGFSFQSVGRGWVVSTWYEIGGTGDGASNGQVVVSFILISDGVPSGYANAYYNPASGTVDGVTSGALPTASCAT